jgi:CHRD domain
MRTRLAWLIVLALVIGLVSAGSVAAADETVTLTARLTGAQEVPPADPDGSGKATVQINVEAGQVCFDIKNLKDTGAPNRGHIHHAPAGSNGPIVVPFFELVGAPTDARNDQLESGGLADCVSGDPAILADIVAHPDQYYVNVHNARFPAGSIRCQLEPRG